MKWFRVTFSTRQSSDHPGELRRLQLDVEFETEAAAEHEVRTRFPDALKILSHVTNRAERRRK